MIVVANSNGTVVATVPTPIYQGGTLGGNLYLLSPYGGQTPVTVAFTLPNGVQTESHPMTSIASVDDMPEELIGKFNIWAYEYDEPSITASAGNVTCQFTFYETRKINGADKLMPIATSSVIFTVQKGVEPVIDENAPTADQWSQIVQMLGGLSGRITNVETQLPALKNISIQSNGVAEKEFTNGATAILQLPEGFNTLEGNTPGVIVVNFGEGSWNNDIITIPNPFVNTQDYLFVVQYLLNDDEYVSINPTTKVKPNGDFVIIKSSETSPYIGRVLFFGGLNVNKFVESVDINKSSNGIAVKYGSGNTVSVPITKIYTVKIGEDGQFIAEGLEEDASTPSGYTETEIFRLAFENDKLVIKWENGQYTRPIADLSAPISYANDWNTDGKPAVNKNTKDISENKDLILTLFGEFAVVWDKTTANESAIERLQNDIISREHFRGYLASTSEIENLSNPQEGDYCYNAETSTKWIYNGSQWENTNVAVPDQVVPKATSAPLMDGDLAKIGNSNEYAAADHVHPRDTYLQGRIVQLETEVPRHYREFMSLKEDYQETTYTFSQNIAQNTADIEELKQGGTSAGIPIEKVGF